MALSLFDTKDEKEKNEEVEVTSEEVVEKEGKTTKSTKPKKKKSSKKTVKKKATKKKDSKKKDDKPLGPQERVFYGKKITRFYADGKWYYNLTDILTVGAVGDQKAFLNELKEDGVYDEVFKDEINKIDVLNKNTNEMLTFNCVDVDTITRLVKISGKQFPGPTLRWFAEISEEPYKKQQKAKANTETSTSASSPPQTG